MTSEKRNLYECVDHFRDTIMYTAHEPIDIISLVTNSDRIDIQYHCFNTIGLCGIAMVGEKIDTIVLNTKRSETEQNFDCAHEVMHLYLHRNLRQDFNCFTTYTEKQNSYVEWQANEGAAQLLVPYQDFIPRFLRDLESRKDFGDYDIIGTLAFHYGVTPQVIRNRIGCLSYEMDQFRQGIDLQSLQFLSKNQRTKLDIRPTNYLSLCEFPLDWDSKIG